MKTRNHSGYLVAQLRKIIHKSQSQFATMVGVSKHTIISVENGRNRLSGNLARRIFESTGAGIQPDTTLTAFQAMNFTEKKFTEWCQRYHPSNEASALRDFEEMSPFLKTLLLAAAKPGRAGNRNRLPALRVALGEWLNEMAVQFKLHDEINSVLPDATRFIGRTGIEISVFRDDPQSAQEFLAVHHLDFKTVNNLIQKYPNDDWLMIEDEFQRLWDPVNGRRVPVETRKLIQKPKCWVYPARRAQDLFDQLHKPFKPHGELLPI